MNKKFTEVPVHDVSGLCSECEGQVEPGSVCHASLPNYSDAHGTVNARFEKHIGGPMPHQTPPPPSRSRRFKKPKKVR